MEVLENLRSDMNPRLEKRLDLLKKKAIGPRGRLGPLSEKLRKRALELRREVYEGL